MSEQKDLTTMLSEKRVFSPPPEFAARAHVPSMDDFDEMTNEAQADTARWWERLAEEHLTWRKRWDSVVSGEFSSVRWFEGAKINVSENCLDRHLAGPRRNKAALIWEGEPGDTRTLTYFELHRETCRFANALKKLGVKLGDRVCIYMPLVPEAAIAMLACSRIGATHSVVFGGFSSEALRDRIQDAGATVVLTADGGWRRGQVIPLKANTDAAVAQCPGVRHVVVLKRAGDAVPMQSPRDIWWHDALKGVSDICEPEALDAEHPLFILYTSGSTGKPKGLQHSTGGYLLGAAVTTKFVFDLKEEDTFWCTADIGWVTGHSYVVYGPLANGATTLMYEGAPNFPAPDRFWQIIDKYGVSIFYTAPTAIRAFIKWGEEHVKKYRLDSLRLLGTVGEPINPEAWMWYQQVVGKGRCPIVDTWWQTETGSIMITPLPGAIPTKPGSATRPFPGVVADVVNKKGESVGPGAGGYLVVRKPWPSMARTIWGDHERFVQTYFSDIQGMYFTGDGARRDEDGYFWVMGRVDDVINVAGHRLGTMEIESAIVSHDDVAEAAVVGRPDDLKGTAIVAFVTLEGGKKPSKDLEEALKAHVVKEIGALARPDDIRWADMLPKTRSGKIMRRLLREIAAGGSVKGDVTTLEDFSVLEKLRQADED